MKRDFDLENIYDLPEGGSRGKVLDQDEKMIINMFSRYPQLTLCEGPQELEQKGLDISYEMIRTLSRANDLKWWSAVKKPLLSEKYKEKRLA